MTNRVYIIIRIDTTKDTIPQCKVTLTSKSAAEHTFTPSFNPGVHVANTVAHIPLKKTSRIFLEAQNADSASPTLSFEKAVDSAEDRDAYFSRIKDDERLRKKRISEDCVAGLCGSVLGSDLFWVVLCVDLDEHKGRVKVGGGEVTVARRGQVFGVEARYYPKPPPIKVDLDDD
jgi:hypothetical protein